MKGARVSFFPARRGIHRLLVSALAAMTLAGCFWRTEKTVERPPVHFFENILTSSMTVADRLAAELALRQISPSQPILAASFVDIDQLEKSSTLGRVVSEQIATRLAQHGYRVVEIKLRQSSIFVKKDEGEFLLSREVREISTTNDVYAVLVGTYAVTDYSVFLSARLVRAGDSVVLTGQEYELDRNIVTDAMLE